MNKGDYVGRPAGDASKDLRALGLKVQQRTVDNPGDEDENTVADVNPTGDVRKGSTVTLSVYGKPQPTEPPTTASPPPPDDNSGPGNGNGNGGGDGGVGGGVGGLDGGDAQ